MESKSRGSYKKYIRNNGASIPKTTWWRLNKGLKRQSANKKVKKNMTLPNLGSASSMNTLYQASSDTVDLDLNSGKVVEEQLEEQVEEVSQQDNYASSTSDPESVHTCGSSDTESEQEELIEENSEESLEDNMLEPLYENANISISGAYCAIMEFKRACRLPFTAIAKLLDLLQIVCPPNNHLPTSVHKFKKFFGKFSSDYTAHYYCHVCHTEYLPGQKVCLNCTNAKQDTLIVTNPKRAITRVLKRNFQDLIKSSKSKDNILADIHDGERWKDISHHGIIFNTDGISPFKSSTITVWPLLMALTILPPTIRMNKDNIITLAIWSGESKPPMSILLEPLVSFFDDLQNNGIVLRTSSGTRLIHFVPAYGLFDLVAKAQVLKMNQFNGVNGCPTCLNPGIRTVSQYYPPDNSYDLRTNESVMEAAEDAERIKAVVQGIKGKSPLTGHVNLVSDIPIDYMHCVLEGVTKWLMEKWLNSCNHASPFYIGNQVKLIDKNLLYQRPPHDFARAPRSLEKHRKHWKANELRNWLLYYSLPLLENRLTPLYLHHYSLLVCAIHILLRSELTEIQIQAAETMLMDFYIMLPELYGINSCTLNAHCLTHLAHYVRLWGPLWTQSLFGFESMNGHMVNMLHSKRKLAEQLLFSIDVAHTVGMLSDQLAGVEHVETMEFLKPMSSFSEKRSNMTTISTGVYSIGPLSNFNLSEEEQSAIIAVTHVSQTKTTIFKKLYYHNTIIQAFGDKGKRNSSICCYTSNGSKEYGQVQAFTLTPPLALIKPYQKTQSSFLKCIGHSARSKLHDYARVDLLSSFIIQVKNDLMPICAIPVSHIVNKCVSFSVSYSYIINIPNNYEHH